MKKFSEREGYKTTKDKIQIESIDDDLRNSLWNLLSKYYFTFTTSPQILDQIYLRRVDKEVRLLFEFIWIEYFKKTIDEMATFLGEIYEEIKEYYFRCEWFEVYDFIEFIANNNLKNYNNKPTSQPLPEKRGKSINEKFVEECNEILERELSAWRFINKTITNVTSKIEIEEIEEAFEKISKIPNVNLHLNQALVLMSDRKKPDFRNSIKESISAVEALCKIITKDDKATLGQALKIVKDTIGLHPALKKSFSSLYGYTSSADGIRHSLLEESNLNFEDAKFFLVSCSAFINYLISKSDKLDIDLT